MGVKGLWKILNTVSQSVPLESLEGKVLAIDISIWLNQALKTSNESPNAHLLVLFHRICKLLFCRIKPIFVFDGKMPQLKKLALEKRRLQRVSIAEKISKTRKEFLLRFIKKQAVESQLIRGKKIQEKETIFSDVVNNQPHPNGELNLEEEMTSEDERMDSIDNYIDRNYNPNNLDINSEYFKSLPKEVQHELILDLIQTKKSFHNHNRHEFPQNDEDFSKSQFSRLLEKSKLTSRLDEIRREMVQRDIKNATQDLKLPEQLSQRQNDLVSAILAKRVVGQSAGHVILWKFPTTSAGGVGGDSSSSACCSSSQMKVEQATTTTTTTSSSSGTNVNDESKLEERVVIEEANDYSLFEEKMDWTVPDDDERRKANDVVKGKILTINHDDNNDDDDEDDGEEESVDLLDSVRNASKRLLCATAPPPPPPESITDTSLSTIHTTQSESMNSEISYEVISLEQTKLSNESQNEEQPVLVGTISVNSQLDQTNSLLNEMSSDSDDSDWESVPEIVNVVNIKDQPCSSNSLDMFILPEPTKSFSPPPPSPPAIRFDPEELKRILNHVNEWKQEVEEEMTTLQQEGRHLERQNENVLSDRYVEEAKELLKLFGIPFVLSPQEAEAQCAQLELLSLCDGIITEDSDVWLFGANHVYRNFFRQDRFVEKHSAEVILKRLGLSRSRLISMALLCGSDYTEGISGIGAITAMEILSEFPHNDGFESLKTFASWWKEAKERKKTIAVPVRKRLLQYNIPENFPYAHIYDAYVNPTVDSSTHPFSWRIPDQVMLREFVRHRFGWSRQRSDDCLLPLFRRLNDKSTQSKITSFFQSNVIDRGDKQDKSIAPHSPSKRMRKALHKLHHDLPGTGSGSKEKSQDDVNCDSTTNTKTASTRASGRKRKIDVDTKTAQQRKPKSRKGRKKRDDNNVKVVGEALDDANLSEKSEEIDSDSAMDDFMRNFDFDTIL